MLTRLLALFLFLLITILPVHAQGTQASIGFTNSGSPTSIAAGGSQHVNAAALTFAANGAAGAGAGTTPTITITGHDSDFQVSVTTGTTPSASAAIVTITFAQAFTGSLGTFVQLTPANLNAATLASTSGGEPYITSSTTSCVINANTTALTGATQYIWNVHVGY